MDLRWASVCHLEPREVQFLGPLVVFCGPRWVTLMPLVVLFGSPVGLHCASVGHLYAPGVPLRGLCGSSLAIGVPSCGPEGFVGSSVSLRCASLGPLCVLCVYSLGLVGSP